MEQLTLGISPCPNDVFIFSGLLLDKVTIPEIRFNFQFADVETLNIQAQRGELDISKISCANFLNCKSNYQMLGSGAALGRGVGPLLLCHGLPWDCEREVLVPGQYTTANFLLSFWAKSKLNRSYLPFDTLYDRLIETTGSQGVVIHEKRFTYKTDGLDLIQDLGTYWEETTGLPIPLGCIIARHGIDTLTLNEAIRASLKWAYSHWDESFALCRHYAQDLNDEVIRAHIELYVNDYTDDLGSEGRSAMNYFLDQVRQGFPSY